jgi:hypothetical protein
MEVYTDSRVNAGNGLREGTVGTLFRIVAAEIMPEAYHGSDALALSLKESGMDGYEVSYGLVGDVLKIFMDRMGARRVEDLRGRNVVGFIRRDEPALQGLAAHK